MTAEFESASLDALEPLVVATFWGELLGRDVVSEPDGAFLPGGETQVGLRFVSTEARSVTPSRFHLHLASTSADHQNRTVERAIQLGGRHHDAGQRDDDGFVVLADPGGNAFCIIEPGNHFLAGCGLLAEVTCDGTRDVGLFWHRVLGWPLVWDRDGETAVQSPAGGTKISWGGPPVAAKHGRNHQRFTLVTDRLDLERDRLLSLGASQLARDETCLELADPDGNEFALTQRVNPTTQEAP